VLNLLHSSAKSGFLFFQHESCEKAVYLHRGEVVFAASNQTVDRLGECLLRTGAITLDQHGEARRAYAPPMRFGKVLVERGHLTPRELWNGVKAQVEEIVRSLFSHGAGTVLFWEGEVRPDNVVRLSLPTRRLVAEGLRRRDELLRFLAWLEAPQSRLVPVPDATVELCGTERAVYEALDADANFAAVCRRAGVDPLSGARILQHLVLVGAIRADRSEPPEFERAQAGSRGSDTTSVRDSVMNHLELLSELTAPIVAVEGAEGIRLRLERVTEEASRRFPELLGGIEIGAGGVIDPERVVERALRFPGEREREVALALGELVSYLEFELLNHPQIPDPEQFLEGLEQLRARI
jgi:hypothetical protein